MGNVGNYIGFGVLGFRVPKIRGTFKGGYRRYIVLYRGYSRNS